MEPAPDPDPTPSAQPAETPQPAAQPASDPVEPGPGPEAPQPPAPTAVDSAADRSEQWEPADVSPGPTPHDTHEPRDVAATPLQPPKRPTTGGAIALFAMAPVVAGLAVPIQIFANKRYREGCANQDDDAIDASFAPLDCGFTVAGQLFIRIPSFVLLAGSLGMVGGGSVLLGRAHAYEDVFAPKPKRNLAGIRTGGAVLVGISAAAILATRIAVIATFRSCRSLECVYRRQLISTITTDAGWVVAAAGIGMLTYSMAYPIRYRRYESKFSVAPTIGPGLRGFSLSGRF